MENLIKTKKLETRFFLTAAGTTNNLTATTASKPSSSKNKERKDIMNTTAPIQFNIGSLNTSNGGGGGNNNTSGVVYFTKHSN